MVYSRILFLLTAITCSPCVSWGGGELNEEDVESSFYKLSQLKKQRRLEDIGERQLDQLLRAGSLNQNNINQILLMTQNQQVQNICGQTQNSEVMPNSQRDENPFITQEGGQEKRLNTYQRMYYEQRFDTSIPPQYSFRLQEERDGESITFPQIEVQQSNVTCSFSGCCMIF